MSVAVETRLLLLERARSDPRFRRVLDSLDRDFELGIRNPLAYDNRTNLAYGTVATPPSPAASGLSVTLTTGHGARFPSTNFPVAFGDPTWNRAQIQSGEEIAYCSSRTGDVLTLASRHTYGPNGARTVVAGDYVVLPIIAEWFSAIESVLTSTNTMALRAPQAMAHSTPGGSVASFDFQNLGSALVSNPMHMKIVAALRTDRAAATDVPTLRINNDSGAHYYIELLTVNGTTVSGGEGLAQALVNGIPFCTAASAPSGAYGSAEWTIPYYYETGDGFTGHIAGMAPSGTGTGALYLSSGGFYFSPTAGPITRVTLAPQVGSNFVVGSAATVYNMPTT